MNEHSPTCPWHQDWHRCDCGAFETAEHLAKDISQMSDKEVEDNVEKSFGTRMRKYRTIYADPPWNQTGGGKIKRGADRHYPLLKENEILTVMKDFLDGKVEDDAHLYMWVANNHLPEALRIIENLGFRYITNIVWAKSKIGLGQYFRGQHEICLFAVKGNGFASKKNNNSLSSLIGGKPISAQRHSKKPKETYDLIEARSDGPYLEMFARNYRPNWDSFGNEVVYSPPTLNEGEEE